VPSAPRRPLNTNKLTAFYEDLFMEIKLQLTEKGKALAAEVNETMHEAHRGAFVRGQELVVFGNDGYENDSRGRAQREVGKALAWAHRKGLKVTDFGTDADGYSWALVCHGPYPLPDELAAEAEDVLWKAWVGDTDDPLAGLFEHIQRAQAQNAYRKAGV
jgi:hypothetical protein